MKYIIDSPNYMQYNTKEKKKQAKLTKGIKTQDGKYPW